MHSNDELGQHQGAALLRIRKHPDAAEDVIWKTRFLKDLLGRLAGEHVAVLEGLALKEAGILRNLFRRQGRDPDRAGRAGPLRLQCGWRRWRRGGRWREAIELGDRTWLQGHFGGRLAAGLRMPNKPQDDAEAGGCEEATVLLVCDLPYLCFRVTRQSCALPKQGTSSVAERSPN